MIVGYARVSSSDQDLTIQIQQLEAYGCERIYSEKVSGKDAESRAELNKMIDFVREGDTMVVTKTDRIARNTLDALQIADKLAGKAVGFRLLDLGDIDINSDMGRVIYTVMSTFAELERKRIRQRQAEGIERAKAVGVKMGRPTVLTDEFIQKLPELRKQHTISELTKLLGVSNKTIYKGLQLASKQN